MALLRVTDLYPNRNNSESANLTFNFYLFIFFFNRFHWISYRLTILNLCLCVALGSGGSQLSLDVISDIVTGPQELYYS